MTHPYRCTIVPKRRSYSSSIISSELPFIVSPLYFRKRGSQRCGHLWHVPRTNDYHHACATGRLYAAHFAQYLKDNPQTVGHNLLGHIATDIDFHDTSAKRGYWIGFFSYLEQLIHAQAGQRRVFDDLAQFDASGRG